MIRFFDYFSEDYRYTLFSLKYNKIENSSADDLDLWVKDELDIEKEEQYVAALYTRRLAFQPEGIFSLDVTYKILFTPRPENDWNKLSDTEILEALQDNALDCLDQVAARMSLIVAETMQNGNHEPLILPPNVISSESDTNNA